MIYSLKEKYNFKDLYLMQGKYKRKIFPLLALISTVHKKSGCISQRLIEKRFLYRYIHMILNKKRKVSACICACVCVLQI